MSLMVTFVIPNRDDPKQPPTLYETWGAEVVPREGDGLSLQGTPWRVKSVDHIFQTEDRSRPTHEVRVRLIEPDHWTQR